MSGSQTSYTAKNADVRFQYAPWPWCIGRMWLPDGYEDMTDMRVIIRVHGGGWDSSSGIVFNDVYSPTTEEVTGGSTSIPSKFIDAGWVFVNIEFPPGLATQMDSRFLPTARFPFISRYIAKCVQFIKSNALNGYFTGDSSSTLGTHENRYLLYGDSAGAIEALWAAYQPDGTLPYYSRFVHRAGNDPFIYRYNHRVRGVINSRGACSFEKFDPTGGISSAAIARFGAKERFFATGAFTELSDAQKIDVSNLPLVEGNYAENQHVGVFSFYVNGSAATGQSSPATGALGSYLGSGTTINYTGSITGTFQVGEQVTDGSVTGTLVGHNEDANYLYVERDSTGVFSGTLTGSTSGATVSMSGATIGGNNSFLEFLSYDEALAVCDAAGTGSVDNLNEAHDCVFGALLRRALERNDTINHTALHRFYNTNDYVASLTSGHEPYFDWSSLVLADEALDWAENDLGMGA